MHPWSAALLARSLKLCKYTRRTMLCHQRFLYLSSQRARCPGRADAEDESGIPLVEVHRSPSTGSWLGMVRRRMAGACEDCEGGAEFVRAFSLPKQRRSDQGASLKVRTPHPSCLVWYSLAALVCHILQCKEQWGWFCCPSSGAPPNSSLPWPLLPHPALSKCFDVPTCSVHQSKRVNLLPSSGAYVRTPRLRCSRLLPDAGSHTVSLLL